MARVPRLEHIHVAAAGATVRFDWAWEGRRAVDVLVLRSDQWFCESPRACLDGSWGQRAVYSGGEAGFTDAQAPLDSELFYSVFARYGNGPWRPPVQVRVFREEHRPQAAGVPMSGEEWRPAEVQAGNRPIEIDGHREATRLADSLVSGDGLDRKVRASVAGQSATHVRPTVEGVTPEVFVTPLARWRWLWAGAGIACLVITAVTFSPLAFLFAAFVTWRAVMGRDAGTPWWMRLLALVLAEMTAMLALLLGGAGFGAAVLSGASPLGAVVVVLLLLVAAGLLVVVMFGAFIFGGFAFDDESQPSRTWVMAVMAAVSLVSVVDPGLAGLATLVAVITGWAVAAGAHRRERAERAAARTAQREADMAAGLEAAQMRPEAALEAQQRAEEERRAAAEASSSGEPPKDDSADDEWWPPPYRV